MKILDVPRSGSYEDKTSARNRFGQYVRCRTRPVNPGSQAQSAQRSRLSANAASWRDLTEVQRAGWESLGMQMQRTDSLGQVYTLTGFQAYVSVNNNLRLAADTPVEDAPELEVPETIETCTPTITPASFSVAFTPTPLGQGERIFVYASPQRSPGRSYEHDSRFFKASSAAGTSPIAIFSEYTARFGTPVVGMKIFVVVVRYKAGFLSLPLIVPKVVTAA